MRDPKEDEAASTWFTRKSSAPQAASATRRRPPPAAAKPPQNEPRGRASRSRFRPRTLTLATTERGLRLPPSADGIRRTPRERRRHARRRVRSTPGRSCPRTCNNSKSSRGRILHMTCTAFVGTAGIAGRPLGRWPRGGSQVVLRTVPEQHVCCVQISVAAR
jgi:hypothetical protein